MDALDAAIALVYAEPPSGFVSARASLVKELKAAKRKDDAARVAALRRPTKLAWALGDAVRRAPEPAEAFFAAVAGLGEPAGSGGEIQPGADLRRRTAELRQAVGDLVGATEGVDPGEATAALLATAADPEAVTALRLGRLAEVPAAGGFGGLALAPDVASADSGDDPATSAQAEAAERERQQEQEEQEEAAARARAQRLEELRARRDEAAAAEEAAARRVEAARASVEQAQADLARAEGDLEEARQAASAAAAALGGRPDDAR